MGKIRPALGNAIVEILLRHGSDGKRLSLRAAERMTGLSPATIGELAKGNARTQASLYRFATSLGEDAERLFLLAGFVLEEAPAAAEPVARSQAELSDEERETIDQLSRALTTLPSGPLRDDALRVLLAQSALWSKMAAELAMLCRPEQDSQE